MVRMNYTASLYFLKNVRFGHEISKGIFFFLVLFPHLLRSAKDESRGPWLCIPDAQLGVGLGHAGRRRSRGVGRSDLEHGRDGPLGGLPHLRLSVVEIIETKCGGGRQLVGG